MPFTITYGSQTNDLRVTTEYDLVGNPIRTVSPGGDHLEGGLHDIVSTISYSRFTSVTTTAKNQQKTEIKNVAGEILRVTDHDLATIKYSYDAHGNLTAMQDASNNITTIIYDELGRKTSMSDPDKGNWVYEYNAFGELLRQTDAKGQIIETQYDLLGRESRRIDYSSPDCIEKVTDWTYDSQVYGLGQLAKVRSSDGHKEVPIYDNFGRSIRLITTLPGAGTFQTSQTFDHFGRPFQSFDASSRSLIAGDNSLSVHEANGLRGTQTIYNDLGYVKEIQNVRQYEGGSRIGFYQRNEKMDERGNVIKYVLGNGVEVNRDFYYTTGLIKQIDAQRPQPFNTAIQSLLYYWDDLGNLTGRTTLGEGDTDLLESFEWIPQQHQVGINPDRHC
ncbi:MAG: YD repeat-containing protein [Porticoccaceae bacterium]